MTTSYAAIEDSITTGHAGDLPPPATHVLIDGERRIGWIRGTRLGFHGFGDPEEAAHAAWVAYRTVQRREAKRPGHRPPPIDAEPLSLSWADGQWWVLAAGARIARLHREEPRTDGGEPTIAFELDLPTGSDELHLRTTGHLVYRTLRKAGLRWALWTPRVGLVAEAPPRGARAADGPATAATSAAQSAAGPVGGEAQAIASHRRAWTTRDVAWRLGFAVLVLGLGLIGVGVLAGTRTVSVVAVVLIAAIGALAASEGAADILADASAGRETP